MEQNDLQRREIHFGGDVQGVGFRYTTYRIAANYRVAGFVQNLPDGRVKLVVEGASEQLDAFVASILSAMENNIHDIQTEKVAWSGDFSSFEIKR